MSNYSTDRDALKAIVKILSPHCPSDVRNALARKLAESARGSSFENLAFRFSDIGHLFHPADPAAADALARDIRAARESGELQSIIPLEQGHIAPLDLLTWPQCPPVSAENPLSYWLPVTPQQSIAKAEFAPVSGTNCQAGMGITKQKVMNAFDGIYFDRDHWGKYLATPPLWLVECRVAKGNKKTSATWNPVLIAIALTERGISVNKLDAVFVGLKDWSATWQEASDLLR